ETKRGGNSATSLTSAFSTMKCWGTVRFRSTCWTRKSAAGLVNKPSNDFGGLASNARRMVYGSERLSQKGGRNNGSRVAGLEALRRGGFLPSTRTRPHG